jgi:thioredoxin-related protein
MSRTSFALLSSLLLLAPSSAAGDDLGLWNPDFAAAKRQAEKEGKDLLIEFTGSDWCPPCIKLWKETFSQDAFQKAMSEQYVLVVLDTPRKTPLAPDLKAQSDEAHEAYAVNKWPTIFLASADGKPYARTDDYGAVSGIDGWTKLLATMQENEAKRDAALALAAKAEGIDKAKHLDAALSVCGEFCPTAPYSAEIDAIAAADPENKTGLKQRWVGKRAADRLEIDLPKLGKAGKWDELAATIASFLQDAKPEGEVRQKALFWQGTAFARLKKLDDAKKALEEAKSLGADKEFGKRASELLGKLP